MSFPKWKPGGIAGIVIIVGALLVLQRREALALRGEIERERMHRGELAAVRAAHRQLTASPISMADLERLRADHATVVKLRGEVGGLRKRTEETRGSSVPEKGHPKEAAFLAATAIPETGWKDAGRERPGAALETALWAAAAGQLDALAATFALEGSARMKAETWFAELSSAARAQYGSPEKLVALFVAKDVPISVRLGGASGGDDQFRMTLRMEPEGGGTKEAEIVLRRFPDGWRLVVPERAIERYRMILKGQGQ